MRVLFQKCGIFIAVFKFLKTYYGNKIITRTVLLVFKIIKTTKVETRKYKKCRFPVLIITDFV
jgi:hypothetical protein